MTIIYLEESMMPVAIITTQRNQAVMLSILFCLTGRLYNTVNAAFFFCKF